MRILLISIVAISVFLFLITPQTFAECKGDFDCDKDVDGDDLAGFAADFGRTDCPACIPAPVAKTGQTTSYGTGDDGDLQMGAEWPDPRFNDNGDGTVTDYLTGLIWLKNASCLGNSSWFIALAACSNLANGQCGLSDGSISGDWRLPNLRELHSLIDYSNYGVALPSGHPFTGVLSYVYYWSSTTYADGSGSAWRVNSDGIVSVNRKSYTSSSAWPVRSDNW